MSKIINPAAPEASCTGYLEHPFKHLAVSSVIDLALLGKLNPTLTGFRVCYELYGQ